VTDRHAVSLHIDDGASAVTEFFLLELGRWKMRFLDGCAPVITDRCNNTGRDEKHERRVKLRRYKQKQFHTYIDYNTVIMKVFPFLQAVYCDCSLYSTFPELTALMTGHALRLR
jgi:hypothetical protein